MNKTTVILACAVFIVMGALTQHAQAQQPQQTPAQSPQVQTPSAPGSPYLMITFFEDYGIGGKTRMIETREDGSQQSRIIDWKSPYNFNRTASHDDSLLMALKPFFDGGWNLVSSNCSPGSSGYSMIITRYFLRKGQ